MTKSIFGLSLLVVTLLCSSVSAQTIYPMAQGDPMQTGSGFTTASNSLSYDYQLGWKFKVNTDGLHVTRLGANFSNGATNTVTLFDVATQAVLAQETCAAGTGWQFNDLATSVVLENGKEYMIAGHTTTSYFTNTNPQTPWVPTGDIEFLENRYSFFAGAGSNDYPLVSTTALSGVVDFGYIEELTITTDSNLGGGTVLAPYNTSIIQAVRGTGSYTWSLASGALPPGLNLVQVNDEYHLAGTLYGGLGGNYTFDVMVKDSATVPATYTKTMTVFIDVIYPMQQEDPEDAASGFTNVSHPYNSLQLGWRFRVNTDGVEVTKLGANLPGALGRTVTLFDVSTQSVLAQEVCGQGAGWQFTGLANPVALLSGKEYVIVVSVPVIGRYYQNPNPSTSWMPTGDIQYQSGTYEVTGAANTFPTISTSTLMGVVDFGYTKTLAVTTATQLPTAVEGAAYNHNIQADFGATPYTWQYVSGNLPSSLLPLTAAGDEFQLSGTPASGDAGSYDFTVEVDDGNTTHTKQLSLYITPYTAIPFSDNFSTDKFWQYAPDWSRAPAVPFTGSAPPRSEPSTDNSPSADNMIAGHVIPTATTDGDYSTDMAETVWLTSPPVDCSSASAVSVSYYRWLGVSIFDSAVVEVSIDGLNWTNIWTATDPNNLLGNNSGSNLRDTSWTLMAHDLTAIVGTSAFVQVRFGIGPTGAIAHTGWCIDDFKIVDPNVPVVPLIEVSEGATTIAYNSNIDFGDVLETNSAVRTIEITNIGGADLSVTNIVLSGAMFSMSNITGFPTVAPTGSGTFEIVFSPTATGLQTATITFNHDDSTETDPFIVNIAGTGVATAPIINVTTSAGTLINPAALDLGSQDISAGPTADIVISIENTGNAALTLGIPAFNPTTTNFILNTSGFPSSLAIGTSTTFSIAFDPTQAAAMAATIEFTHNDGSTATPFVINLTGIGITPEVEVREGSTTGVVVNSGDTATLGGGRDLGAIDVASGATGPITISLQNTGSLMLDIFTATLIGPNAPDFTLNTPTMPALLNIGADTTFTITFDPTLGGIKNAQIEFTHNDLSNPSPFIIPITGTAVDPAGVQINTNSLPSGTSGVVYLPVQLSAIQGTGPYTWSLYSGGLPAGLTLSTGGEISGTPSALTNMSYTFTVRVADNGGATHEKAFSIAIAEPLTSINMGTSSGGGGGGCTATSSANNYWLALPLLLLLIATRRRKREAQ